MLRRILLALCAVLPLAGTALIASPAEARPADTYLYLTSSVPTVSTPMVSRGRTIRVNVYARDSRIVSRSSTLWQGRKRIYDWSPKPGYYTVRTVLRYQIQSFWEGWDADGNYIEGADRGALRTMTRITRATVHFDESPGCVSYAEFRAIRNGMTATRVHRIFGTSGRLTYSGSGGTGREYRTCEGDPEWSYVAVSFDPRVWHKWRYISY
jgi:hypothetical protein